MPASRRRGRPGNDQRGQALALFALSLAGLLVATGLVIDGGIAFMKRRDAQNAADLGALAGTQVIADYYTKGSVGGSDVWTAINDTVRANGCPAGGVPCTWSATYIRPSGSSDTPIGPVDAGGGIPGGAQGVEVRISTQPPTFFLPVIGQNDWDVGTEAAALTASLDTSANGGTLLPIGIDPRLIPWPGSPECAASRTCVEEGTLIQFSLGKDAPGNFSWLTWFGPVNAGELAANICEPRNPPYTFPTWIEGDVGKTNSSNVRDCLAKYIGKPVLIPLWDEVRGNGSHGEYRIIGVASFILKGFGNPAIDSVSGYFQRIYSYVGVPGNLGGPPCKLTDPGCVSKSFFLGLIR